MASEDGYPLLNLLEVMGQGDEFSALEAERDLLFLELESMSSQPSCPQPPLPQAALLDLEEDDRDEQPSIPLALPPATPRPQAEQAAAAAAAAVAAIPQNPHQSTQGGGGAITLLTAGAGGEHPSLMESSVAIASKAFMGRHRVTVESGDRALIILLRPDVSHDDVVALTEQVLLTHAGVVRRVESDKLEVESAQCFVYVGVSGDRLRGVLLHVLASPVSEARADALEAVLGAALHSELFTLGHLKSATGGGGLHPTYVESLQTAMEIEMLEFVAGQAEILEESVTQVEKKCARLMTLLKPAYTKAGQTMPSLTHRPPQQQQQQQQQDPQQHFEGDKEAKRLLLRARRTISTSSAADTYFDKTVAELDSVLGLLEAAFETQAAAKLWQREQACAARKSAIEAYRLLVVSTLFSCKQLISENLRQLARIDDAVVFEGPCLFEGKRGTLALTPRHMVFHSPGLLLIISPTVRVIPIATISALGVLLITPDGAAPGPADVVIGGEILKITCAGGAQLEFAMPDATPGHTRRVADLIGCLRTLISKEPKADSILSTPAPAPAPAPVPSTHVQPNSKKVDKISERLEALRGKK